MNQYRSFEEWRTIIETARSSGMSDKDWCMANGVSINSFYYNVRRLRNHACDIPVPSQISVTPKQDVVPLQIVDDETSLNYMTSSTAISINCNGINISIYNNASTDVIKAVVTAIRG